MKQQNSVNTEIKELKNRIEYLEVQTEKIKSESRIRLIISVLINLLEKYFTW